MSFAENFKAARKKSGLTQQQLADELGMERSAIAHYENGTSMPQIRKIQNFCKVLGVTIEELLED